jgi:amidase
MFDANILKSSGAFCQVIDVPPYRPGRLSGLTFAVKDMIDVAGCQTLVGSPDWAKDHPLSVVNAVVVDQCLSEGALCRGKTVMGELAFGLAGSNPFYGMPLNPKANERVPGGSSSGSASAVACGLIDFALATDAAGSSRVPAANCGIFGLRPSHGLISVAGVTPASPSFDTVGIFTGKMSIMNDVATILLGLDDQHDIPDLDSTYVLNDLFEICDIDVRNASMRAVDKMKEVYAANIKFITSKEIIDTLSGCYFDISCCSDTFWNLLLAETWNSLGAWIENKKPRISPVTKHSLDAARGVSRTSMAEFCRKRHEFASMINTFLGNKSLLCIPSAPSLAPVKNAELDDVEKQKANPYYPNALSLNAISSMASSPQISLPITDVSGIPVGVSLMAAKLNDKFLLHTSSLICNSVGLA